MTFDDTRHHAMRLAYKHCVPCLIVLDTLEGLRTFCAPHPEYLDSEPSRYYPIETVHPDGVRESAMG